MNNPKGSLWNKWDLHVHSNASPDSSLTPEEIVTKMLESGITMFSATDHSSVDNIDHFWEIVETQNEKGKQIYFLPGIELKTDKGDKSVHLIGIFPGRDSRDHKITTQYLKENFLAKIGCTDTDVLNAGQTGLGDGQTEAEYRKRGLKDITVNFETAVGLIHEIGGVSIVHAGPKSNSIEEEMEHERTEEDNDLFNSLGYLKTKLMNEFIDICELPNWNDKNIKQKDFYLKKFNKPSIICSDAHSFSDIGTKYTWIKGDPTFEGLKQILYEPDGRVKLQAEIPEEKSDYLVIDKVRFFNKPGSNIFPDEWIEINPYLNSIIGGKSSGKSLLLFFIAKTIAPQEIEKAKECCELPKYSFEYANFEVMWRDGHTNNLLEEEGTKSRLITYIPQMYINKLIETDNQNNLNSMIRDILLQNEDFRLYFGRVSEQIRHKQTKISTSLIALFDQSNALNNHIQELKTLGDKAAIEIDIEKIKKEIEDLISSSGVTEDENNHFLKLKKLKETKETEVTKLTLLVQGLKEIKDFLSVDAFEQLIASSRNKIDEVKAKFSDDPAAIETIGKLFKAIVGGFAGYLSDLYEKEFILIDKYQSAIKELAAEIESLVTNLKPFMDKIQNQEHIDTLTKKLEEQQKIVLTVGEKKGVIRHLTEQIDLLRKTVIEDYGDIYSLYRDISAKVSGDYSDRLGDINLTAKLVFDIDDFNLQFTDMLDGRTSFRSISNLWNEDNEVVFNENGHEHIGNIQETFTKLYKGEASLKSGRKAEDAIKKLCTDYFLIKYDLVHRGDTLSDMSPGKRGLILLQLILHLSNARHPILIDQPEDNLDNRTIFQELNDFIKNKKVTRQIIMVTHNANLVVSTDSEQIIVANQSGQQQEMENRVHRFEYVTGALECSFENASASGILYQKGIKQHVCEILEGGEEAFKKRQRKYAFI